MKINKPSARVAAYNPPPRASNVAQIKAIEASKIRTFWLMCGHSTDWEIAEFYDILKMMGEIMFWCEKCGDWFPRKPKPEKVILPEEPMF